MSFRTIAVCGLDTVVADCDWCDDATMNAEDENHEWQTYELEAGPEHMCPACQRFWYREITFPVAAIASRLDNPASSP